MKVLLIDLLGSPAQEALLRSYVKTLGEFSQVTLAGTRRFFEHHSQGLAPHERLVLPELPFELLRKRATFLDQSRKILELRRHLPKQNYDHIVILSYDTKTFSLLWNRSTPCWLVHHKNLDELCDCWSSRLIFGRLKTPTKHLVFCEEFADMLRMKYNFHSEVIPHPATVEHEELSVAQETKSALARVFVPSQRGCKVHGQQLRDLALSRSDMNIVMQGDFEFVSRKLTVRKQFLDYHEQIHLADAVFCVGRYHYRISTVAFDALSAGKPVLMWDGPFANSLRRQFPTLVKTITRIEQIPDVFHAITPSVGDRDAFRRLHHNDEISRRLRTLLKPPTKLSVPTDNPVSPTNPVRRAS